MVNVGTTVGVITTIWALVGIAAPIVIQLFMWRSPNKGIIQICLILSAVCCYMFWLSTYLCQLNPLFGPQLDTKLIRMMQLEWPVDTSSMTTKLDRCIFDGAVFLITWPPTHI